MIYLLSFRRANIQPEMTTGSCHLKHSFGSVTIKPTVSMAVKPTKCTLPVVTSGFNYAHLKDLFTIFPVSIHSTGSDDRKLSFSAFIWHCQWNKFQIYNGNVVDHK